MCVSKLPVLPHPAVCVWCLGSGRRETCGVSITSRFFFRIARTAFSPPPRANVGPFRFQRLPIGRAAHHLHVHLRQDAGARRAERADGVRCDGEASRMFLCAHASARFLLSSVWARLHSLTRLQRARCLLMGLKTQKKRYTLLFSQHTTLTHSSLSLSSFPHQVPGPVLEGGADRCVCGWVWMSGCIGFLFSDSPTPTPSLSTQANASARGWRCHVLPWRSRPCFRDRIERERVGSFVDRQKHQKRLLTRSLVFPSPPPPAPPSPPHTNQEPCLLLAPSLAWPAPRAPAEPRARCVCVCGGGRRSPVRELVAEKTHPSPHTHSAPLPPAPS